MALTVLWYCPRLVNNQLSLLITVPVALIMMLLDFGC